MIYLDYAASTPVDPAVVDAMSVAMAAPGNYANPSSTHSEGRHSNELIAEAAGKLAGLLHTSPDRLIWTSGATESDNLAIFGAASYRADRGRHAGRRGARAPPPDRGGLAAGASALEPADGPRHRRKRRRIPPRQPVVAAAIAT